MGEAKPEIFGVPDVSWLPKPPGLPSWGGQVWLFRFNLSHLRFGKALAALIFLNCCSLGASLASLTPCTSC